MYIGDLSSDVCSSDLKLDTKSNTGAEMSLVDDAITAAKFDESTAFPTKIGRASCRERV